MIIKAFNDIRATPVGITDASVVHLHDRVAAACREAANRGDWWATKKFAEALERWEFSEPVCILCDRFCYVSSVGYSACPKDESAIEMLDISGLSPSEFSSVKGEQK